MDILIILISLIITIAITANLLSRWSNPIRLTFYLKSNHKVSVNVEKFDANGILGGVSWNVAYKTSPMVKSIDTNDIIAIKVVHRWFNLTR